RGSPTSSTGSTAGTASAASGRPRSCPSPTPRPSAASWISRPPSTGTPPPKKPPRTGSARIGSGGGAKSQADQGLGVIDCRVCEAVADTCGAKPCGLPVLRARPAETRSLTFWHAGRTSPPDHPCPHESLCDGAESRDHRGCPQLVKSCAQDVVLRAR